MAGAAAQPPLGALGALGAFRRAASPISTRRQPLIFLAGCCGGCRADIGPMWVPASHSAACRRPCASSPPLRVSGPSGWAAWGAGVRCGPGWRAVAVIRYLGRLSPSWRCELVMGCSRERRMALGGCSQDRLGPEPRTQQALKAPAPRTAAIVSIQSISASLCSSSAALPHPSQQPRSECHTPSPLCGGPPSPPYRQRGNQGGGRGGER